MQILEVTTFFNGSIDEVKMWSVALTAAEIKKNMDEALAVEAHDKLANYLGKDKITEVVKFT